MAAALANLTGESKTPKFGEFAREYQAEKLASPNLREATKRSFEYNIRRHLVPAFGHLPIDKLGTVDWNAWITAKRQETGTITRFFNARKAIVEILNAGVERGIIARLPNLENPDEPRDVGRAMTPMEQFKILRRTKRPFFRFFFFVLMKQGCRPREIAQWQWTMIKWNEPGHSWIEIPAKISKCDRSRSMPLSPAVSRRLYRMWMTHPTSNYVFPHRYDETRPQMSYNGAWVTACRWARIKKAVPYDTRRTIITKWMASGEPAVYVAKILDTSVKQIEQRYAKKDVATMEGIVK